MLEKSKLPFDKSVCQWGCSWLPRQTLGLFLLCPGDAVLHLSVCLLCVFCCIPVLRYFVSFHLAFSSGTISKNHKSGTWESSQETLFTSTDDMKDVFDRNICIMFYQNAYAWHITFIAAINCFSTSRECSARSWRWGQVR